MTSNLFVRALALAGLLVVSAILIGLATLLPPGDLFRNILLIVVGFFGTFVLPLGLLLVVAEIIAPVRPETEESGPDPASPPLIAGSTARTDSAPGPSRRAA